MYIKRDGRFPKNCCSIGKRAWLRISSYIYFHFISSSRGIKVDLELERSTNASICTTNPGVTKRPRRMGNSQRDDVNVAERTK